MSSDRSAQLRHWIDRHRIGDVTARDMLLNLAAERLRILTRQMMAGDRLNRWEETDDVLQEALLGLRHSLADAKPADAREFLRLAAFHIRRSLARLARHYFGPLGMGTHAATSPLDRHAPSRGKRSRPIDSTTPSGQLMRAERWIGVHDAVERLPDDERELTELLWFHGLSRVAAASVLGVSESTVQRRWMRARLALYELLQSDHSSLVPQHNGHQAE